MNQAASRDVDTADRMSRNAILNILTVVVAFLVPLAALEVGLRFLVEPSPHSWGRLFGIELPPLRLAGDDAVAETSRDTWYERLVVDGRRITYGDLWGYYRPDPLLGYAPQEGSVSANGWWRNNELGARSSRPISPEVPPGHKRVLVFGESFAAGSRVPQEDAWPSLIDNRDNGLEVFTFGVDGYGMGQSFLRFQILKSKLDYDAVMLMFVPTDDLWRDINVVRSLADPQWSGPPMPRFIVEDNRLALVQYHGSITDEQMIWQHAATHDAFHCAPWGGWSIVAKIAATAYCNLKAQRVFLSLKRPSSSAMQVSRRIFATMEAEVKVSGKLFLLVILPTDKDLRRLKASRRAQEEWAAMASSACGAVVRCLDLRSGLLDEADWLDKGYDGSHFGPQGNRVIARLIEARLAEELGDPR